MALALLPRYPKHVGDLVMMLLMVVYLHLALELQALVQAVSAST
jgi:hypothetical protein